MIVQAVILVHLALDKLWNGNAFPSGHVESTLLIISRTPNVGIQWLHEEIFRLLHRHFFPLL